MKHFTFCTLVVLLLGQSARADLVVEWQDFAGAFPATGGAQAGTGDLDLTSSSNAITPGTSLFIEANNSQFNDPNDTFLDLFFDGSAFSNFVLTYDTVRTDGSGANAAPDTINWAVSLDAGALTPVGSNSIAAGANNGLTIDLTGNAAVNAATSIRLQATFAGASGGNVNSLDFDNIQVNATAVPEPSAFLCLALVGGVVWGVRKRLATVTTS